MPYDQTIIVPIVMGKEGVYGIRNADRVPMGGARLVRNVSLEGRTMRTEGGAASLGTAIGSAGVARLLAVLRQRRSTFSKPFEVSQRPRLARQTPRLRSHCALPANVGDALGESDPARSAQPESRTRTAARTILLYFMTASTVG